MQCNAEQGTHRFLFHAIHSNLSHRCVIQLGYPGTIAGFEVDTAFFTGNHSPFVSVEGFVASPSAMVAAGPEDVKNGTSGVAVNGATSDESSTVAVTASGAAAASLATVVPDTAEGWEQVQWTPILPKVALSPDSRHGFKLEAPTTQFFTHIRFRMFPDGGVARLRVYGKVYQVLPEDKADVFDLAAVGAGARVEAFSDAHFGHPSNLLLPGRGHDMSDGWETKRSRAPGHVDWSLIRYVSFFSFIGIVLWIIYQRVKTLSRLCSNRSFIL